MYVWIASKGWHAHAIVELQEKTGFYISISGRPRVPTTSGTSNICQSLFTRKVLWGVVHTKRFRLQPRKKELKKKISRNYTCFYRLWRKIFKNQVLIVVEVAAAGWWRTSSSDFLHRLKSEWHLTFFIRSLVSKESSIVSACACSIKQKQNLFSTYFRLLQYEIEHNVPFLNVPNSRLRWSMFFPYSSYRNVIMYTTIIDRNYRLFGQEMCKGFGTNDKQEFAVLRLRVVFRQNAFLHSFHCDLWTAFRHRISYSLLSLLLLWLDGGVAQLYLFA